MSDRYANVVKFWLRKYFRDLKNKLVDSRETSRNFSDIGDENIGTNHPEFLKELQDLRFNTEEQELLQAMRYKSLLLIGKEGRGKQNLIESVCNELNLEIIEVCNSSNRSSSYLDQIYEATQSQNVLMSSISSISDIKPNGSQESTSATVNKEPTNFMPSSKASVIIVRDFDKPLEVDKGFQNKIVRLAETSKSPFILVCEKVPKRLKKLQDQGTSPQTDRLYLEKFSLDDIALLFYIILTIENNFSSVFKDLRYQVSSQSPELAEDFEQKFKEALNSIELQKIELLSNFDDVLEITKYLEGNLTQLFTKIEFHKNSLYAKRVSEFKKECFLALESKYRKKHDIFVRFEKNYFSKQMLDMHRGAAKKIFLNFNCELEHLTDVNKLTRSLDFFQEPIRDLNLDPRSTPKVIDDVQKNKINDVTKMAEFLDRMGTLDIVETSILKNKLEPDWDYVEQLYGDNEASKPKTTDGQQAVVIIPLKKDDSWNQFEIEEKTFTEIQKESLLNRDYLETLIPNPLNGRVLVTTSPYDEDLIL